MEEKKKNIDKKLEDLFEEMYSVQDGEKQLDLVKDIIHIKKSSYDEQQEKRIEQQEQKIESLENVLLDLAFNQEDEITGHDIYSALKKNKVFIRGKERGI